MAATLCRNVIRTLRNSAKRGALTNSQIGFRSVYSDEAHEKQTHFGFETVTEQEKTEKVYHVFENVATSYDVMNDLMSFGIHRLWKDRFISVMNPAPGTKLLDVAGGTGDIAFRFLNHTKKKAKQKKETENLSSHVTVCDINKYMLRIGKKKGQTLNLKKGISWVAGDAQSLPFADDSFDAYTIAFGIRNVTRIQEALYEAFRVLSPGGRFLCLEFSQVTNPVLARLYDGFSFNVIPVMGHVVASDWNSYQYLVESIRQFPNQEEFKGMIEDAGFRNVTYENLSSGIAAIHSGFKL
ncbi:2-methoxy-6-polyprenyl-1,4-benzoquinol methylase, mitochondrial [Nematostella vectensis]|uniref:2-methoxy-6-polyprenyl-1,4-benzoquinol methylase, mitochondrial n=1 Tax=Nematostella vectensis TaxID=45351 RepID=UPI002076E5F1|nr:2-methoxy-6-polyprenyl-1,4-benzoquinol methylase, mitochondrial [Nematostella vectensis]